MNIVQALPEDQFLVRYLLGELSEEQEVELEKEFFRDDELFERFLAVEADLLDSYVRGELPDPNGKQFERRLLSAPRGRDKAEFARALARLAEESRARRNAAERQGSPQRRESGSRWTLGLSLAAAAVLLIGVGWLLIDLSQARDDKALLERQVADLKRQPLQLQAKPREAVSRPDVSAIPGGGRSASDSRQVAARSPVAGTVSFLLVAGLRDAGESNIFSVPPGTETVALKVVLETSDYATYSALIEKVSGANVWKGDRLRATRVKNGKVLILKVPAKRLLPGQYILDVRSETGGKTEEVAGFSFRISI